MIVPGTIAVLLTVLSAPRDAPAPTMADGIEDLAFALHRRLSSREGNLCFSPLGIHSALTLAWLGAKGETARELEGLLQIRGGQEEFISSYEDLRKAILKNLTEGSRDVYALDVQSRVWSQKGKPLRPEFLARLGRIGASQDFADLKGPGLRPAIRAWTARVTRGKLSGPTFEGGALDPTLLVLASAVYFKSAWLGKFSRSETRDLPFQLKNGGSARVPVMHQVGRFDYAGNETVQVLVHPYSGREMHAVIVLPRDPKGLAALESSLSRKTFADLLKGCKDRAVNLFLPRFKVQSSIDLSQELSSLGAKEAFLRERADFSGMAEVKPLYLGEVDHSTVLDVDEDGTEGASLTSVEVVGGAGDDDVSKPVLFRADHPFLFLIRHTESGAIVFLARVEDPRPR